jgi:hypothetical protein
VLEERATVWEGAFEFGDINVVVERLCYSLGVVWDFIVAVFWLADQPRSEIWKRRTKVTKENPPSQTLISDTLPFIQVLWNIGVAIVLVAVCAK